MPTIPDVFGDPVHTDIVTINPDCDNRVPANFILDKSWVFGPTISHADNKDMPTVAADWYNGRLQFLIYEEFMGDQTMAIRFKDGKIAEIEIPRSMQKLIVYEEDQKSAWIEERDKDGVREGSSQGS